MIDLGNGDVVVDGVLTLTIPCEVCNTMYAQECDITAHCVRSKTARKITAIRHLSDKNLFLCAKCTETRDAVEKIAKEVEGAKDN